MRNAGALALLLAITIGVYWQVTLSDRYTWLENPDQALQVRPWLDYQARELHAGRLPLWDPYLWGGQTLIGQVQPGLANPLNWLLFALPLSDGHIPLTTLHWYWVLLRFLAAAFTYWLCRDLGAHRLPSVAGAAIFALAGFMGHSGTPQFVMSALWTPLILLFFARVWRGERPLPSAAWCGAALGAALLSGHHNVPIYTGVLLGACWMAWLARHWRSRQAWTAAAVFAAVTLLTGALQILPAIEYGRQAVRWSGAPEPQHWKDRIPYGVHAEYSIGLKAIPGIVKPGLSLHANSYFGYAAALLALSGLWLCRRSPMSRLLALFALGGLLLALGKDTPVQRLAYQFLPLVEKARYPAMAIVLFQAAAAALAALALDAWSGRWRAARIAIPLLFLALFLAETLHYPPPVLLPRDRPGSYAATLAAQSDIADFLRAQPGWFRVDLDEDVVPYNFGDWYGIEQFGGYVASMPEKTHRILGHPPTPRIVGIEFRVAKAPSNPAQVEVFQSRSGLKVFRDPRIGEPLWAVYPQPCGSGASLRVVSRTPGENIFDADLACPGLVAVGDPTYTGWRAWVDGRPVRIQEVEEFARAVPVPAGRHRVEFRYRPGSVYWGAALSALGIAAAVLVTRYGTAA